METRLFYEVIIPDGMSELEWLEFLNSKFNIVRINFFNKNGELIVLNNK